MKTASHLATAALFAVAFALVALAPGGSASASPSSPHLTCSPAPCVLPDTQLSAGSLPANETPMTANPNNGDWLLVGANDTNCFVGMPGFFTSNDGGNSWKHKCISNLPGRFGVADPGLGYDLNNNAYITGLQGYVNCLQGGAVVAFQKSSDNGATWSSPAVAVSPYFSNGGVDKEWLQIDTNPGSQYANTLYISATQFDDACWSRTKLANSRITVSHSTDGGATWTTVPVAPEQFLPALDELTDLAISKDGTVYVSWFRGAMVQDTASTRKTFAGITASLLVSKSTDGGNTWSEPSTAAQVRLLPDPCHCNMIPFLPNTKEQTLQVPAMDVDNSNGPNAGHLYVVMNTWTGKFLQVKVAHSGDGGATWSAQVPVAPPSADHDQFFAWLSVSNDGTVGVTWLDRRNDPANLSYEAFAALSTDGGVTFGDNYKISSAQSNPNNDGFGGTFMGDYTGSIWAGNTLYASWMDSRNGKNMQAYIGGYQK